MYQMGSHDPKPIVIIFNTSEDKKAVFQQKHRLKSYRNKNGDGYFINDYLPAKINEKKRREREIIKTVKSEDVQDDTNKIEYTKAGLKVGPTVYTKKVRPPHHLDLLKLKSGDMDEIQKIMVKKGTPIQKEGNTFIPYCADARDTQAVNNAYLKIRLANARARHIVCAYNIPGSLSFLFQDCCDDEDYGMGKVILDGILRSDIKCKAIFVVRHCGKVKLGAERGEAYYNAAQQVMKEHPYNQFLKIQQHMEAKNFERARNKKTGQQSKEHGEQIRTYETREFHSKQSSRRSNYQQKRDRDLD